jgi:hypothetical protein
MRCCKLWATTGDAIPVSKRTNAINFIAPNMRKDAAGRKSAHYFSLSYTSCSCHVPHMAGRAPAQEDA